MIAKLSGKQKQNEETPNPSLSQKEKKKTPESQNQKMNPEELNKLLASLAQSESGTLKNEKQQTVRKKKSGNSW